MDSVKSRIGNCREGLTPNEAKVAEYCLGHPDEVINNSIHGIAKATGVSVASVSRLAAALGYRDWKEMRLALARDSVKGDNPVYPEIAGSDADELVIEKVFGGNSLSIAETLRRIDRTRIVKVAKLVRKAETVVFFGAGGSGYLASDEALRFSHLRPTALACTENYSMMLQAAKMGKGQVAFGFSHSGRSRTTVSVLAEARKCGATTVGISNFRNTPLEKESEYYFQTAFPSGGGTTAALTGRAALLSIMDAIYVLVVQYGGVSERVKYMDEVLEGELRVPARRGKR